MSERQLELPWQLPCWLVQGPDAGKRQGAVTPMGRHVHAWSPEEARAIEEEDGCTVVRVVPSPQTDDDWRALRDDEGDG